MCLYKKTETKSNNSKKKATLLWLTNWMGINIKMYMNRLVPIYPKRLAKDSRGKESSN